jgi:hypothetical protein
MQREDYFKWVLFFFFSITLIILGITGRIAILIAVTFIPDDVQVNQ